MTATQPTTSDAVPGWELGKHRTFCCAGRFCTVVLLPMFERSGKARFELTWSAPPERMTSADIEHFERSMREAKASLLEALE